MPDLSLDHSHLRPVQFRCIYRSKETLWQNALNPFAQLRGILLNKYVWIGELYFNDAHIYYRSDVWDTC